MNKDRENSKPDNDFIDSSVVDSAPRRERTRRGGGTSGSPVDVASRKAKSDFVLERRKLTLPVTKNVVKAQVLALDPRACFASPLNKRKQQWLNLDNPEVAKLYESIKNEGQRDPVLARSVQTDGKTRYEIIYGTRRRAAVEILDAELRESAGEDVLQQPLRALVLSQSELPDVDARRLSISENDDRDDISLWEEAVYLKEQSGPGGIYAGKSQEFIADSEGVSQARVSQLLKLAEIPDKWVELLVSPSLVTKLDGLKLLKILSEQKGEAKLFAAAKAKAPYADLKSLLAMLAPTRKAVPARGAVDIKMSNGVKIASLSKSRGKEGRYKVDLVDVTEDEMQRIIRFLERLR